MHNQNDLDKTLMSHGTKRSEKSPQLYF